MKTGPTVVSYIYCIYNQPTLRSVSTFGENSGQIQDTRSPCVCVGLALSLFTSCVRYTGLTVWTASPRLWPAVVRAVLALQKRKHIVRKVCQR